jgi:hypothetical protein
MTDQLGPAGAAAMQERLRPQGMDMTGKEEKAE